MIEVQPLGMRGNMTTTAKDIISLCKEALTDPGLDEAYEFVFRDYAKKQNKWMLVAHKGKPAPALLTVIKAVTKKFNGYGTQSSMFSWEELTTAYQKHQLKHVVKGKDDNAKQIFAKSFGFETLPAKWLIPELKKILNK